MIKSRADQIEAAFLRFHEANPIVWDLFERFALQAIAAGRHGYGSAAIFERIRWHMAIETVGEPIKLNNNYRAYYARMFAAKHPEHAGFFRCRKRTSIERPPGRPDRQVFVAPPAAGERALLELLRCAG
jgi:hypothetical protein